MTLSIIIPAHNEEQAIGSTLDGVLRSVTHPCEIIVVADHCSDRTEEIVAASMRLSPQVKLVRNERSGSFSNAVFAGLRQATGELVVPVMADACDDPATIGRMAEEFEREETDVVCASRYMQGGGKIGGPWLQDKLSRIVCYSLRLLARIPTWDSANSFKMYRREFLRGLPYDIPNGGTEYSLALFLRACAAGARVREVPTVWTWREKRPTALQELKILKRFPRYWPWYRRGFAFLWEFFSSARCKQEKRHER